jgi:tRNA pseudouridine38-40 synthase
MARFALVIEYDGRPFCGWQRVGQGMPSVQQAIEQALARIDPLASGLVAAGRTDSGVHATGQVAHVDLAKPLAPGRLRDALNAHLRPDPIAVIDAFAVAPDFSARFSAIGRRYRYRLIERRADLTVDRGLAWRVPRRLDVDAMNEGAALLLGEHDFSTFRDAECQAGSALRTLDVLAAERIVLPDGREEVHVRASARSFLHRQVRSMVGSLVLVGFGWREPRWMGEILAAADRSRCGQVAPADGLCLVGVDYPPGVLAHNSAPR